MKTCDVYNSYVYCLQQRIQKCQYFNKIKSDNVLISKKIKVHAQTRDEDLRIMLAMSSLNAPSFLSV